MNMPQISLHFISNFHAVNKAIKCTTEASSVLGDKRIGVIWHTQGSGKSLTMAFFAGKINDIICHLI